MSLNQAHAFAFSLATTLMVSIVIFQAGDGSMGVMPAGEYDGELAAIVHEVDPFVQSPTPSFPNMITTQPRG